MSKTKIFITIIILILLGGMAYYFYQEHQHKNPAQTAVKAQLVTVDKLQYFHLPITVDAYAHVITPHSVEIKAQASGIITSLDFTGGQQVSAGQALLTLKSNDTDTQLEKLQAQMLSSQQTYKRSLQASQLTPGAISQDKLQTQKLQYQQDLAAYNEAKEIHNISAPINGIITITDYSVGDFINEGDILATIVNPKDIQLQYQLPSRYLNQVKVGQLVSFNNGNTTYQAKVSYIGPQLSVANEAISLRASFTQPVNLLANDFGQITQVLNAHAKVLAIPQNLVQTDAQGFYVYTFRFNKVSKQYFVPGIVTEKGLIEVKSGLKPGISIITTEPKTLMPGEPVRVQ